MPLLFLKEHHFGLIAAAGRDKELQSAPLLK